MNQMEWDQNYSKTRAVNNSVEYRSSIDHHSGIHSSKSMQKNQKYLASINSGSKTATAEQKVPTQHQ